MKPAETNPSNKTPLTNGVASQESKNTLQAVEQKQANATDAQEIEI